MRNSILIIVLIALISCNNTVKEPKEPIDKIAHNIENNYSKLIDNKTLRDGTLFYSFALTGDSSSSREKKLLWYIDKTLNKVYEGGDTYIFNGDYMYMTYNWNMPDILVKVQSDFYIENDSIYMRVWINKK